MTYDGSSPLTKICFVSYKDANVTNYSIRIFNKTNDQIIAEKICTNTSEEINVITSISNLPLTTSIFEVQIKKTGGNPSQYVYLESVTFFY
jgi:hypothetical protein